MLRRNKVTDMNSKAFLKANQAVTAVLKDPAASDWLKATLRSALSRDAVDAANDAELLADILRARADALLGAP